MKSVLKIFDYMKMLLRYICYDVWDWIFDIDKCLLFFFIKNCMLSEKEIEYF